MTTTVSTKEMAPFLRSLRRMLDTEHASVLCWTPDGEAFEIRDLVQLTKDVLPKYFKHAKYSSFQRQLNYFNFRKWTRSKSAVCTFSNPQFLRDAPDLMWKITRKKSGPMTISRPMTRTSGLAIVVPKTTLPLPRAVDADAFGGLKSPTDATAMLHHQQHQHQQLYYSSMPLEPMLHDWSYPFGTALDESLEMNANSLDWIDSLYSSLA
jgi:hypothetical protein